MLYKNIDSSIWAGTDIGKISRNKTTFKIINEKGIDTAFKWPPMETTTKPLEVWVILGQSLKI